MSADYSDISKKHMPVEGGARAELPDGGEGARFPAAEGEMARRVREFPWETTPLGSIERWPLPLRIAVDLCLGSQFAGHVWWGPELINIYNDAHIPILGDRHRDALGRPASVVWEDLWPLLEPQVDAVMRLGKSAWNKRVHVVMKRNGVLEDTWFTWCYSPIRDAAGNVAGLMCVAVEETADVLVEKQRDYLDMQRRMALDTITDFAYIFDLRGRFTFVNKPLLDLWGLTLEQAVGKDFYELQYPPELAAKLQRQIQQVINSKTRLVDETSYTNPAGMEAYYQYIFTPVLGAGGAVEAVAGSTRDISDIKSAEQALRLSREQMEIVVKEANVGVWYCPLPFDKLFWDAKVKEHFHLPPDAEVSIDTFFERIHPDDRERTRQSIDHSISQKKPYDIDYRTCSADGKSIKWIRASGRAFFDAAGNAIHFDGITIDITERKQIEDDRERLLESERAARADAEAANHAKDRFLAVLSHELRTPLSPVVMTIHALETDPDLPPQFREDLATLRRNIDLEVKLIDDLLDLSRVTNGKLRLDLQPVHAHDILEHALRITLNESGGKKISIVREFNAPNDCLRADPARLQQVFWNLLRNALKFTPSGGTICVRTSNADDSIFVAEISDTGVGIPPQVLPRIFDAFEQGDARVTREFGGLGLGLAIAKSIVLMHGGEIHAASPGDGCGATFTLQFPVDPDKRIAAGEVPQVAGGRSRAGGRARILVVEDHADTSKTMLRLLSGYGFQVRVARDAAAALALARQEPFDLLISDIGLPDSTGYDLMRQVRSEFPIKGIAMSGYGMDEDIRKSREAGFSEHLVKPLNFARLEAVLRRVIET